MLLRKTSISWAQRIVTSFVSAMLNFRLFKNLHIYRWNRKAKRLSRVRVASKASLRYALGIFNKVSNFAFDVCKLTCVGVKINHLLFIAEDMTMCIKLRNCDILYQFHLWLFLFMTGSVYFSCSSANKQTRFPRLDIQTSLDFIQ